MTESETRPKRLYLMRLTSATIPTPGAPLVWPVVCYLIQMSDGTNALVDSGTPADYQPPSGAPVENAGDVIAQLAALGLRPAGIDLVVCTHFDTDHAGHHDAFAAAEFIVQREQYDVARGGASRYAAARSHWDHPGLRYRRVEGDIDVLPGVRLIETSGHAPGHQSVLVRLPNSGPVLLAADAVVLGRLFTAERPATPLDDAVERPRASTRKLLDLVARENVALVVFGHDGAQWQTLRTAPSFYD